MSNEQNKPAEELTEKELEGVVGGTTAKMLAKMEELKKGGMYVTAEGELMKVS